MAAAPATARLTGFCLLTGVTYLVLLLLLSALTVAADSCAGGLACRPFLAPTEALARRFQPLQLPASAHAPGDGVRVQVCICILPALDGRADILISIRPEHMADIAAGRKNHEYRKYLLPAAVQRVWFYTTAPISAVQYVVQVGGGRAPGQVLDDGVLGNADFNAGRKVSKFGYEIVRLWKLNAPLSLATARARRVLKQPPQKYQFAPRELVEAWPLGDMQALIDRRVRQPQEPEGYFEGQADSPQRRQLSRSP